MSPGTRRDRGAGGNGVSVVEENSDNTEPYQGGPGGGASDVGGGGGGRIAYRYKKLIKAGTAVVLGGASGASGTFGHGDLSAKPFGGRGVITRQKL